MIALDASAVLAVLRSEEGAAIVHRALHREVAIMTTANLAEVLQKMTYYGLDPEIAETMLDALGVTYVDLSQSLARLVVALHHPAPALSLADRCCVAVAQIFGSRALTSDQVWASYVPALGVEVDLICAA